MALARVFHQFPADDNPLHRLGRRCSVSVVLELFLLQAVDATPGFEQPGRRCAVDSIQAEVSGYGGAWLEVDSTQSRIYRSVVAKQVQTVDALGESILAEDLGRPDPVIVEIVVGLEVSTTPTDTTDHIIGPTTDISSNVCSRQDPVGISFVHTNTEQYEL